jgi:hypothetical protein
MTNGTFAKGRAQQVNKVELYISVEDVPAQPGPLSPPLRRSQHLLRGHGHHLPTRRQAIPGETSHLVIHQGAIVTKFFTP